MARNGSGTYTNPYPNFVSGTVISSTEVDTNNSQIATALTQSIAVDGQAVVTADLPLATHKFTGMKVGTASTDSLSLGQAQAEAFVWCGTAGGSADAITLTPAPPITAYAAGQRFVWMAGSLTNTTGTTVAISGLGTIALQDNGAALTAGQHAAGKMFMGVLNTTSTVQIMNVQVSGTDPLIVSSLTVTGDATIGDDLTLLSDASILGFGLNTDVTLVHNHDLGLTLSAGANATQLTITSTDAGASVAPTVALVRNSASPAAADQLGHINFYGEDAGSNETAYAQIIANIVDPTGGGEDGSLDFYCIEAGTAVKALNLTGGDVSLPTDAAILKFGADQDVLLTHVADSGLEMSVTGNNQATLSVTQDKADAGVGPYLNLNRYSASPDAGDGGGIIQFHMENNNNQLFTAAQIYTVAVDVADSSEDASLVINTMKAGTATTAVTVANTGLTTLVGLSVSGNTTLGDAASDTVTVTADVASHLIPSADSTYDIGATASRWRQGFFDEMEIGTNTGVAASSVNAMFMYYAGAGTEYGFEAKTDATTGTAVNFYHSTTTNCGSITVGSSATAFNTSSDYRLKENVTDMSGAITRVKALQPKRFSWIADEDNELLDGFLAHEVDDVVPQAIHGEKDAMKDGEPSYQGIDQSKLVPLLTGALQEAITKIESLEARVAALEM
jgi:hypothetical protein